MPSSPHPDQAPSAGGAAPGPRFPDWERIEHDFRAGILSVREIAVAHSISHTAINKRAKRDGWERDLTAKIHAKAEAEVSKRAVSKEVSKEARATERQIVEANAEAIVSVRMGHRTDIGRARSLVMRQLQELELQTDRPELFEEIEQLLATRQEGEDLSPTARAKLQEALSRATSLSSRSSIMRSLAESLRTVITLEREAWGIKVDAPEPPGQGLAAISTADLQAMRAMLKGGTA